MTAPELGNKLKTKGRGDVWHYGIYVGARNGLAHGVVHNSKILGRVVLEEWAAFANGSPVTIAGKAESGFEEFVIHKALAYLNKKYNLFFFNCEHFVNLVVDGEEVSPQLQAVTKKVLLGAAAAGALYFWTASSGTTTNTRSQSPRRSTTVKLDRTTGMHRNTRTGQFAKAPRKKATRKRRAG